VGSTAQPSISADAAGKGQEGCRGCSLSRAITNVAPKSTWDELRTRTEPLSCERPRKNEEHERKRGGEKRPPCAYKFHLLFFFSPCVYMISNLASRPFGEEERKLQRPRKSCGGNGTKSLCKEIRVLIGIGQLDCFLSFTTVDMTRSARCIYFGGSCSRRVLWMAGCRGILRTLMPWYDSLRPCSGQWAQ
jgi:hypothetical protein